jgi:hypothetical protein
LGIARSRQHQDCESQQAALKEVFGFGLHEIPSAFGDRIKVCENFVKQAYYINTSKKIVNGMLNLRSSGHACTRPVLSKFTKRRTPV